MNNVAIGDKNTLKVQYQKQQKMTSGDSDIQRILSRSRAPAPDLSSRRINAELVVIMSDQYS